MYEEKAEVVLLLKEMKIFQGLDETQLGKVAAVTSVVDLAEGGNPPFDMEKDYPFYVLCSGKALFSGRGTWSKLDEVVLKPGDFFGADVLFFGKQMPFQVEALTPVRLLRIEAEQLAALVEAMPKIADNLREGINIYRLTRNKHFLWLNDDEIVHLVVRKHPAYLFVSLIPPVVVGWVAILVFLAAITISLASFRLVVEWFGMLLVAVATLWAVWRWIDWSNDYYAVTEQRVVWLERVVGLYDSRQEIPMVAIHSEEVKTTLLGRYLGYGDLEVQAFMSELAFRNVGQPAHIQTVIDELRVRAKERKEHTDTEAMEAVIRQKIEPPLPEGDEIQEEASRPPLSEKTGPQTLSLRDRLGNYFKTRIVEGEIITYRKHVYILMTKVFVPTLIGCGVIFLSGYLLWKSLAGEITFPSRLTIILMSLVLLIVPGLWWLYQYVDWRNDIYRITKDRIIDSERKPLGDEITKSAPIGNILSLDYERAGVLGILLNFGNVIINVGTETKFTFVGIHDPARAQQDIFNRMYSYRRQKEQAEASKEWDQVSEWLAAYHRQVGDIRRSQNPPNFDQNSG